mgnify:CR=1 FL=1
MNKLKTDSNDWAARSSENTVHLMYWIVAWIATTGSKAFEKKKRDSVSFYSPLVLKEGIHMTNTWAQQIHQSSCVHIITFIALVLALLVFAVQAQAQSRPAPTHAEVQYADVHERNVLDFWQVESSEPAALVVFIHGGGFQSFSKDRVNVDFLREFLGAGIAVAAINYRLVQQEIFPAAFHDARLALQFLGIQTGSLDGLREQLRSWRR